MDTTTETQKRSGGDLISNGKFVLVQRGDQEKIIEFQNLGKITFGKGNGLQEIELQNADGLPFYTTFRVQTRSSETDKKRVSYLEPVLDSIMEPLFVTGKTSSGKDNRSIVDDGKSQPLGCQEIAELREKGISGPEILDTLISNSKTFSQKTEFSQEKYVKKKVRAYGDSLVFTKPTLIRIADYYFQKDPVKIMQGKQSLYSQRNLRPDSLSQLLVYSNIYAGGRYMVFETGCSGLIISGVLQRLGGSGLCLHLHTGSNPQRQAVYYMNFTSSELTPLKTLDIYYVIRNVAASPDPVLTQEIEMKCEAPPPKKVKLGATDDEMTGPVELANDDHPKTIKSTNRIENEESSIILNTTEFDGLIICAKEHPLTILQNLLSRLVSSAPFVIFCQYPEPLLECFLWLKERNVGINLNIFDNWYRAIQIQLDRTHPQINMSPNGGYILSGIYIK